MRKDGSPETGGLMNTIIGRDTTIHGTLDVKGALRIDGNVQGKIQCTDAVTIGSTGKVEAEIEAGTAIVAGHMCGNVVATDKVELQANCQMDGDLRTKSLVIEEGAIFCGACNMKGSTPNLDFLKTPVEEATPIVDEEEER